MQNSKRVYVTQGASILLALGVGILIGARSCSETKIEVHREYMMPPKPKVVEKIVYECPPEVPKENVLSKSKAKISKIKKVKKTTKKLPKETEVDQNKRRRLLAFVRSKSKATLMTCRGSGKEVYRLNVTLLPKKDGTVHQIKLSAPPREVPGNVLSCLRGRMKTWTLPAAYVVEDQPIIWGLTL